MINRAISIRRIFIIQDDKQVVQLVEGIRKLFFVLIMINVQNRPMLLILDKQQILPHQPVPLKLKTKNRYMNLFRKLLIQTWFNNGRINNSHSTPIYEATVTRLSNNVARKRQFGWLNRVVKCPQMTSMAKNN